MKFLETVPLLIIDDLGMRKLPLTAAEELGDHHAPLRARQHDADFESPRGGLGQTAWRRGRS
jgi:hypothetical protein